MPGDADALRIALLAAASLGAISLLLMLQVLFLAQSSARRQRRRKEFQATWRPLLAAESLGIAPANLSPPTDARERRWWLQLWNHMQETVRGEAHGRLNRLLNASGLDRHAVDLLGRRDMRAQLVALACLRHLADPRYWSELTPLLHADNPIKAIAAADAMVNIDPVRAMHQLLPVALQRRDWAPNRLALLCRNAGHAAVTPVLLEWLSKPLPGEQRGRLMGMLPFADPAQLAAWARPVLDDPAAASAERGPALGVLGALRDPADHARIAAATRDPDPAVRGAAALALMAQATRADAGHFMLLLTDRDWATRQLAATALATLPGLESGELDALAGEVFDRYGREALQRAISDRQR
jgi:hypothetical protein